MKTLTIKVSCKLSKRLEEAKNKAGLTKSEVVRRGITDQISEIEKSYGGDS